MPTALAAIAALACIPAAQAGPNRCATSGPPERSPTWTDGAGTHWFDQHGVWTQGPDGPPQFGTGGVDFDKRNAQVDLWTNHSAQVYVGQDRQCAIVGDVGNAPAGGEFPVQPAPAIVQMPWLHRSGNLFQADDGRTTILRGVDYAYDQEIFERPYDLTDADFARMASWGFNLLRIRISGYRSGYLPDHAAEPGYWEHLDQLIADANRHGLYVLPATVTGDTEDMMASTQAYERAKFVPGSPNRAWWIAFQTKMFERYRDWPGVVGFDTINEDDSYPPYIHDRVMMGPAHAEIDAALRAHDSRHIYFQEPSGWSYWGADYWPGMMNGVDIGDANRFFCPKWKANGSAASDLDTFAPLATQSNAPMFMCEMWVNDDTGDAATEMAHQRDALAAMDARLIGGARATYPYGEGYGMLAPDGSEQPWVHELARPYVEWAGGRIDAIHYDFDARKLVVGLTLDGSGPTEIFTSAARTYPGGFTATASNGAPLTYDAAHERVVLPAQTGAVTITIAP